MKEQMRLSLFAGGHLIEALSAVDYGKFGVQGAGKWT